MRPSLCRATTSSYLVMNVTHPHPHPHPCTHTHTHTPPQENQTPPQVLRSNMDSLNSMVRVRDCGRRWWRGRRRRVCDALASLATSYVACASCVYPSSLHICIGTTPLPLRTNPRTAPAHVGLVGFGVKSSPTYTPNLHPQPTPPPPASQIMFAEEQVECRRVLLMQHFGEAFDPAACRGTCDICRQRQVGAVRAWVCVCVHECMCACARMSVHECV